MDLAIGWARQTGLKVVIDLHGAPRSQNGFDNSGHKVSRNRPKYRAVDFTNVYAFQITKPLWTTGNSIQQTLQVLDQIQMKYGAAAYDDVIAGIELLNGPLIPSLDLEIVKQFERTAYSQQRAVSDSCVIIVQDGFQEPSSYNDWLTPSIDNSEWVAIDHHEYQVFTNELVAMQPSQHRQYVCDNAHTYSGADKWTFVGEWSAAMTDCTTALNGYGIGARYDGTYPGSTHVGSCAGVNSMETWSQQFQDDTRWYIETQMEAFEANSQGWVFWIFKTEASPEWDAFRLIDAGIFPQ